MRTNIRTSRAIRGAVLPALAAAMLALSCGDFYYDMMGTETVLVTLWRWVHPRDLLTDNFDPKKSPFAGSSFAGASSGGSGSAIVTWRQDRGGENHIMMRQRRYGIWSSPADLTLAVNPAGGVSSSQQTAMNLRGDAIVVWLQNDGIHTHVYGRQRRGGFWRTIDAGSGHIDPEGQSSNAPHVAMDDNGNAIIVWSQSDGTYSHIFKSEYRGGAWTHPSSLAGDNIDPEIPAAQPSYRPRAAMDNAGNAIIAWSGYSDASNVHVYRSEYRSGSWTHPANLGNHIDQSTIFAQSSDDVRVAMGDNGEGVIVWSAGDGTNTHIYMTEYRGGAWSAAPDIDSGHIDPDGQNSDSPAVAMDRSGNTIIVWMQSDGGVRHIYRSEYRGGAWVHPAGLADNIDPDGSPGDSLEPRVAMEDGGSAVITWFQADLISYYHIYMAEYRDGVWRYPVSLQTDNIDPRSGTSGQNAMWPAVSMSDGGYAVIAWHASDGSYNRIYISEYAKHSLPLPR
ncbi:MAG TPA: hypothetical protein PK307_09875 [Spirochaetota bacterium]|nr:hypothetical protein [Spirochaetota bacterium]HOD14248.1 hypothetical protein [Spirochaetota bacterium]HPG50682.1 hypothetical protein [Spirochaetota bacterium]HPN12873.1 hypothetical protein [Spirochaetota bacterium]HQL82499.1 hypothetical protein [Spirochaetota bacterium]